METVVVTGAAGFIGSNLSLALLSEGYRVVGIDNFDDMYARSFKEEHIATCRTHPNFTLLELNIASREALVEVFTQERPALVAHLAAKPNARAAVVDPYPYVETNIQGTLNVLEASKLTQVGNIVSVSSSSVYGNTTQAPWREDAAADRPLSPYGATKRAAELFAHTYHHNFGMNITCLRYFNVYGEHNRPDMVPYLWMDALLHNKEIELSGAGIRKRDYTYVGDTVRATIAALKKPLGYEIINIGNNHPLSLAELLTVFEKVLGCKAAVRERPSHSASVEDTWADISKAQVLLNWKPEISIEEGVSRLATWFRSNRL